MNTSEPVSEVFLFLPGLRIAIAALLVVVFGVGRHLQAGEDSGPKPGEKPPGFKVWGVTGKETDKEVDYLAQRADKVTVVVFVQAKEWTRPMARYLKELDKVVGESPADDYVVAVWLTDDQAVSKDYLPKAQMSLKFEHTALTVFPGDTSGPNNWGVNNRATLTTVILRGSEVTARFGYISLNETDVPPVKTALLEAAKKP